MENLENENSMNNDNSFNTHEKFTTGFIDGVQECIKPLLEAKEIVNKCSEYVPYYIRKSMQCMPMGDYSEIEEYLQYNMNLKTYSNWFKTIIESSFLIVGKIFLKYDISIAETEKTMLQIKHAFWNINRVHERIDLFDFEAYNDGFKKTVDIISKAQDIFGVFHKNYNGNPIFVHLDLPQCNTEVEMKKARDIYQKLLELNENLIELNFDDKLYPYLYDFYKFSRELAKTLFYFTGMAYIDQKYYDNYKFGKSMLKYFKKLERCSKYQVELSHIFNKLKEDDYGSKNDKNIFNTYEDLKDMIKNIIFLTETNNITE